MTNKHKIQRQRNFMNTTITITVIKDSDSSTIDIADAIEDAYGELTIFFLLGLGIEDYQSIPHF